MNAMTKQMPVARVCEGCKKAKGTFAFQGRYWHLGCFQAARKTWHCQKCGKVVDPGPEWTGGSLWCSLECSDS